jgi:hypothetical protein
MKTLRKGNDFKRMSDKSLKEFSIIKSLLENGWNYCSKSEYKKSLIIEKSENSEDVVKTTKASKKKIQK